MSWVCVHFIGQFVLQVFIMAQSNRWTVKILALPVFDEAFAEAVLASPLADLAFVIAMDVGSPAEFSSRVHELCEVFDRSVADVLVRDTTKLEQFWSLAIASEKVFLQSTANQLGFGLCETRKASIENSPVAKLRKQAAIKALVSRPMAPCKKPRQEKASESSTPLLDQENAEKVRWAGRLEAIGKRAGAEAKLLTLDDQSDELSSGELAKLRHLVLISGAPRTMSAHIRSFERFEQWTVVNLGALYPIGIDKVLKYCISLDQRECGPSVIPAFKTSLKWVASRLAIGIPDLDDRRLRALQESVVVNRAKTLKEAIPVPIEAVGALECLVCSDECEDAARIFVWWLLCMIFASLRFDDAIHVRPQELIMKDEGLFGVAWQTKVDRRRAGTRFVVPAVGFRQEKWLETGWLLFQHHISDRDFWVYELNTRSAFLERPPTYQRSVQWLRWFINKALNVDPTLSNWSKAATLEKVQHVTAHSCRVTLLDAAVHAGRSSEEIGLQANWKDPGPLVLKYTRNRSSVPATMIKQLVKEMTQTQHPIVEDEDTVLDDVADSDLGAVEYFIKTPAPGSYYDYKYHATSFDDSSTLACKKFSLDDCTSVGSVLPDFSVLCKACARHRPDICKFFESAEA